MTLMEQKLVGGRVSGAATASTIETRAGVEIGRFAGLLATWDPDTGGSTGLPDRFVRGAFSASLAEHRARGDRPVRLKYEHQELIGRFPIDTVRETARGLEVEGEINLEFELGRRAWALLRQGALTDLSVGFVAVRSRIVDGIREISRALLLEGSLVWEPAQVGATVTSLKETPASRSQEKDTSLESILETLRSTTSELRDHKQAAATEDLAETAELDRILAGLRDTRDLLRA